MTMVIEMTDDDGDEMISKSSGNSNSPTRLKQQSRIQQTTTPIRKQ